MCAVHLYTARKKEHTWICEFERRNKEQKGSDAIHQKIAFSCDITCMNACGDAFRFRPAHDSDDDDGFPLSLSLFFALIHTDLSLFRVVRHLIPPPNTVSQKLFI